MNDQGRDQSFAFTHGTRTAVRHRVEVVPMDPPAAQALLCRFGEEGWELSAAFPVPVQQSRLAGQDHASMMLYCVLVRAEPVQYELAAPGRGPGVSEGKGAAVDST